MTIDPPAFRPVAGSARNQLLDALRGFASFGILLVNIRAFADYGWLSAEQRQMLVTYPVDRVLDPVTDILVDTKFITIFSILFGAGFALQQQRAATYRIPFKSYFTSRMAVLFVIACLHAYLLWFGDIIRYYAIAGLLLLLVCQWNNKAIKRLAFFCCVPLTAIVFILNSMLSPGLSGYPALDQIRLAFSNGSYKEALLMNWRIDPLHNFLQDTPLTLVSVFGKILIGYWLGRLAFFDHPERFKAMRRNWLLGGLVLGLVSSITFWALEKGLFSIDSYSMLWLPFVVAGGLILHSLLYIVLFIQVYEHQRWRALFTPLCMWGGWRLPITFYKV